MVRRVDIKYKNEFQHKGCFSLLVLSVKSKLYRYKNEFWHKACFFVTCEAFPVVVYTGKAWTQVLTGY